MEGEKSFPWAQTAHYALIAEFPLGSNRRSCGGFSRRAVLVAYCVVFATPLSPKGQKQTSVLPLKIPGDSKNPLFLCRSARKVHFFRNLKAITKV